MRSAILLIAIGLAPAVALADVPRAVLWVAQAPPTPPKPPKPPKPPSEKVIVIKSGPGGATWTVPTRKRAFLGVQLLELTDELREHFGVGDGTGIMIAKVEKDTPASKAGVRVGDVLVAIDGSQVGSGRQVVHAIRTKKKGDTVALEVIRKGKKKTLKAELEVRETPQVDLSGLWQFHPGQGKWRLEVDGEDVEMPMPPMPQLQELRERVLEQLENDEVLKQLEHEKKLEKRLREMEKKLRELEDKLEGKARKTSHERDAWVPLTSSRVPRLA